MGTNFGKHWAKGLSVLEKQPVISSGCGLVPRGPGRCCSSVVPLDQEAQVGLLYNERPRERQSDYEFVLLEACWAQILTAERP